MAGSGLSLFGFGARGWGGQLILALGMTLAVTLAAMAIGAVLGAFVTIARLSPSRIARVAGNAYTTLFRGVPELLVIYLIYFGGSSALGSLGALFGVHAFISVPSFLAGAVAVGVISGAYQAEVYRGAYRSLRRGEIDAARAIGMSCLMRFRRIIGPQVIRAALPGLGNVWQLTIKDSALISVTGLAELMRVSEIGARSTHQFFGFYIAGGCLYLLLTGLSNGVFGAMEHRLARSRPGRMRRRGAGRS